MPYFRAFQGEGGTPEGRFLRGGEHLRDTFEGEGEYQRDAFVGVYHLPGAGKMIRVLKVGIERGYSRRMMPLTRAMAWRYDFSSSNGGYLVLSETMQI